MIGIDLYGYMPVLETDRLRLRKLTGLPLQPVLREQ